MANACRPLTLLTVVEQMYLCCFRHTDTDCSSYKTNLPMLQAQIFVDKDELKGTSPLYEFIMQFLLLNRKWCTALKGDGLWKNEQMKRPSELFSFDETPMVITFVDEERRK